MFKSARLMVLCSLLLSGCVNMPNFKQMQQDVNNYQLPKTPEEGKAMVYVVRPSLIGAIVRFNVFLDDTQPESEMGFTRANQYIYFNVSQGVHTISSKAENWSVVNINAKPNEVIYLRQDPTLGLVMAGNRLYQIDDVEGKYHVKHLSLGKIIKLNK